MARKMKNKWTRPVNLDYDREIHTLLNMAARAKLTPKEIAEKAKSNGKTISTSTIYKWRRGPAHNGTRYPKNYTLEIYAEALGFRRAGWIKIGKQSFNQTDIYEPDDTNPFVEPRTVKKVKKKRIAAKKKPRLRVIQGGANKAA